MSVGFTGVVAVNTSPGGGVKVRGGSPVIVQQAVSAITSSVVRQIAERHACIGISMAIGS